MDIARKLQYTIDVLNKCNVQVEFFNMGFFFIGILWNLSSKDSLKEKLARESLVELTERVLIPLSGGGESAVIQQSQSETDIFYNITGCLRYTHKHNLQYSGLHPPDIWYIYFF